MKKKITEILSSSKLIYWLLIAGLFLRLFLSIKIYSGDVNNHVAWGKDVLAAGLSGIYQRSFQKYGVMTPTYPPIPIFFFTFFYWLYRVIYQLSWNLNLHYGFFPSNFIYYLEDQDVLPAFLKIPAIFADLGIAYFVFLFAKKFLGKKAGRWPIISACLVLFNPAFIYNSAYWGQIEAVPIFFILASFYFLLFSERNLLSAMFLSLAFLTKQSSIIFAPLFALGYVQKFGLKKAIYGLLFFMSIFYLFFIPFFKEGNILIFPIQTYINKIQTGSGSNFVTDHAFNFWALTSGLGKIPDFKPFWLGLPYSSWGYGLFGISLLIILFIVWKTKSRAETFIFAAGLIPFSAFLFLTRMHERYLEPALPFLLIMCLKKKRLFPAFAFLSLFYLTNLYHNWWAPDSKYLRVILTQEKVLNTLIIIEIGIFIFLCVRYICSLRDND